MKVSKNEKQISYSGNVQIFVFPKFPEAPAGKPPRNSEPFENLIIESAARYFHGKNAERILHITEN